ncbi:hypothetical protein TNCV_2632321 [Trichonephila clavipes]|nr:hypothetical protein TNCV_2632321 [Trichonephila clavipes]
MSYSLRPVRVDGYALRIFTAMERKELLINSSSSTCFVIARKGVVIVKNLDVKGWKFKRILFSWIFMLFKWASFRTAFALSEKGLMLNERASESRLRPMARAKGFNG